MVVVVAGVEVDGVKVVTGIDRGDGQRQGSREVHTGRAGLQKHPLKWERRSAHLPMTTFKQGDNKGCRGNPVSYMILLATIADG